MKPRLLIATGNPGKLMELKTLLAGIPFECVSPHEVGIDYQVDETGHTFEENARLKALTLAKISGLITLADDSGLEVDALDGEPGIMSARYAGKDANDRQRNEFLLQRLETIPLHKRTARFRCVIAVATPEGRVETRSGECEGLIALSACGTRHFGYDPVFLIPQLDKTMAELPDDIKNSISHRAKAASKARALLATYYK